MMAGSFKGWLKIYLFYGAVFFLLGLFGYTAANEVKLTAWAWEHLQGISRNLQAIGFRANSDQTLPAFADQSGSIIFLVYPAKDINPQFTDLVRRMQGKLQGYFRRVTTLGVNDLSGLELEHNNHSMPWLLIGFKQNINSGQEDINGSDSVVYRNSFYFGTADQNSPLLAGKFIRRLSTNLPEFTLNKQIIGQTGLYELSWDTVGGLKNPNIEIMNDFLEVVTGDSFKAITAKTFE